MADVQEEVDDVLISSESGAELKELHNFLQELVSQGEKEQPSEELASWASKALESLPAFSVDAITDTSTITYKVIPIQATSGSRTYRLNLYVDDDFGDQIALLQRYASLMLERIAEGRSSKFIAWAKKHGLTKRRSRKLAFPHPLPYINPAPTQDEEIYAEEAGIIAAAFHFVLSQNAPGIKLIINRFSKPSNNGKWTTGSGTVNYYTDKKALKIRLNTLAIPKFDEDSWAGTIAHELLHNLGWGHPEGDYGKSRAIVNYKRSVEGHAL